MQTVRGFVNACGVAVLALAAAAGGVQAAAHQHGQGHRHGLEGAAAGGGPGAAAAGGSAALAAFEVGTAQQPLVARPLRGPLALASGVAAMHLASSHAAPVPAAARLALTEAQATKRLSKRCQKLVKSKRPSKLSKAERKRRTACLKRRRELIAASKKPAGETKPGVTAPEGPTPGPKPSTAPVAGGDAPAPTSPTATTPAATTPSGSGITWEPCTPSSSAVKLTSFDAFQKYTLSRACAPAGTVNFTFENIDASGSFDHNAYIAPANAKGEVDGELVKIAGEIPAGDSRTASLTLAPGRYLIICTVPGHQGMNTPFQVY